MHDKYKINNFWYKMWHVYMAHNLIELKQSTLRIWLCLVLTTGPRVSFSRSFSFTSCTFLFVAVAFLAVVLAVALSYNKLYGMNYSMIFVKHHLFIYLTPSSSSNYRTNVDVLCTTTLHGFWWYLPLLCFGLNLHCSNLLDSRELSHNTQLQWQTLPV